jgi:WD40 repeat protein
MKHLITVAFVGILLTLGCNRDRPQVDVGSPTDPPKQAEGKKPQELIVGKWEGERDGVPDGREFTDNGNVIILIRITASNPNGKVDKGPARFAGTYKLLDENTLELTVAFGKEKVIKSKIVLTEDRLTVTDERGTVAYKRIKDFSANLTKPAPEKPKPPTTPQIEPTFDLVGHKDTVNSVVFSPDSRFLASASSDNTVRLWEVTTGKAVGEIKDVAVLDADDGGGSKKQTAMVYEVAFSPDGKLLAMNGSNATIKVWDAAKQAVVLRLKSGGSGLVFSPDGKRLVAGTRKYDERKFDVEDFVTVWDSSTGKELLSLPASRSGKLIFSPDGKYLAQGGSVVTVWDTESRKAILPPEKLGNWLRDDVSFHFGTKQVATIEGNQIKLYDLSNGRETTALKIGKKLSRVAFSPGGKRLAANVRGWEANAPFAVNLWDVATGKESLSLIGHKAEVRSLAFSPDGKWLASGGADKTVKVWNVSSDDDRPYKPTVPQASFVVKDDKITLSTKTPTLTIPVSKDRSGEVKLVVSIQKGKDFKGPVVVKIEGEENLILGPKTQEIKAGEDTTEVAFRIGSPSPGDTSAGKTFDAKVTTEPPSNTLQIRVTCVREGPNKKDE